eukprot:1996905-Rhodomonas_salina.2
MAPTSKSKLIVCSTAKIQADFSQLETPAFQSDHLAFVAMGCGVWGVRGGRSVLLSAVADGAWGGQRAMSAKHADRQWVAERIRRLKQQAGQRDSDSEEEQTQRAAVSQAAYGAELESDSSDAQ